MSEREGGSHAVTHVLIVDDHRSFADALELVLRSTLAGSPRCSCAASVAEGLRLVSQGRSVRPGGGRPDVARQ